jgi:flagellar hook-associated protein 2
LSGLASSINSANLGVTAQVEDTGLSGAPYRLEISSNSTGAANAFTVRSNLTGGPSPDFTDNEIGPVAPTSVTGTATPTIGGAYSGSLSQGYYFTVTSGGTVGSGTITISYTSDSGESGTITVPASYTAGSSIDVADGLTLSLGAGTLNTGDQFSIAAFNPNLATAQNAEVQAGNQFVSSANNSVTNAIPGVTLNLNSTGGPSTVTVAQNVSGESADVSTFVNAFNTALSGTVNLIQAQPNQTAPALADNTGLETLLANLSQSLGGVNLSTLGISVDSKTGQLDFDSTTFATKAASDPIEVTAALSGIYNALNPTLTSTLAPTTGLVASDITSIQNQITQQNTDVTNLQNQVNAEQTSLTNEYAQLQAEIVSYQNTQSFLDAMDESSSGSSSSSSTSAPVGSNLSINT